MISLIRDFVEGFSRMESVLESVHLLANEIYHHPSPVILLNGRNVYLGCLLLVLPTSPTGVYLSFWSRQITFLLYPSSPTLEIIRYPRVRKGKKHETVTSSSVTMHIWLLTRTIISLRINDRSKKGGKSIITIPLRDNFPFFHTFRLFSSEETGEKIQWRVFSIRRGVFRMACIAYSGLGPPVRVRNAAAAWGIRGSRVYDTVSCGEQGRGSRR